MHTNIYTLFSLYRSIYKRINVCISLYMRRMYHNKIPMQMLHASASIIFISKQSMPYQPNIIACALQSTASTTFGMRYWQFALCPLVPLPRRKTIVNDFDI